MNKILDGLRIVETVAFVAAPLAGMTMAQLGADVIRVDPICGGLDAQRWPVTSDGKSLYWVGLNKGKRSLAIDTSTPKGQEIVRSLITQPGPNNGIFVTNFPNRGWYNYDHLKEKRDDLIMVNLLGSSDGKSAVDYTINCAAGFPHVTGPEGALVNHVLPAWDVVAGINIALALLAAERHRRLTGEGQYVRMFLSDIVFSMVGNLGYIQEVQINKQDRPPVGNYLYGAFGKDFETRDGRAVYLAVVTDRMWLEMVEVMGMADRFSHLASLLGLDFKKEGDRYEAREVISAIIKPWIAQFTLDELSTLFEGTGVCWGPYQTFMQMIEDDARVSTANPIFSELDQPGIGKFLVPGSPIEFTALPREKPRRAPILGENTDEILEVDLGISVAEIGRLRDSGIVAGPIEL